MDYAQFSKTLKLPGRLTPPLELVYDDIVATPLTRADLADDVRGINGSIELINRTRGGGWPTEAVSDPYDYVDLVWHECEFREGASFAYVVRDTEGTYLGCARGSLRRTVLSPIR